MMQWNIDQIVQATGGQLLYGEKSRHFNGVGIDSRQVEAGMLFVAICGQIHDGHSFIDKALSVGVRGFVVQSDRSLSHEAIKASGAVCVAVKDTTVALGGLAAFQRSRLNIPVVAITGSNGKTTTRQMTALLMKQRYKTLATRGNLNNEIGLPLTLFNLTAEHQAAVVELGMNHAGEIDRLGAICQPTIGVITNVGSAHLEYLGSVDGVARAKAELLPHIDAQGSTVLNMDDPLVAAMAEEVTGKVVYFGIAANADVRAEAIQEGAQRTTFDLCLPHERATVMLQAMGRFMVSNALAAAAVGHLAGLNTDQIKAGLEAFTPVKGRLSVKQLPNGLHLIDDTYNANPDSMAAALGTLTTMKGDQRAFIVVGDMLELGDQAKALHEQVGQQAAQAGAHMLYAHGAYADSVIEGAQAEGMREEQLYAGSKSDIAGSLIQHLRTNDWLLVKGSRGMAMETVVAAIVHWAT